MTATVARTREAYEAAFQAARVRTYPEVDAFERRMGHIVDRARLEAAARVLACPLKAHAPHWQHGRVIYAAARAYFNQVREQGFLRALDIGTAKGFSALCLQWAICHVVSVDVIDPAARLERNTIAEIDGPKTLAEILVPWPEARLIEFVQSTGVDWLLRHDERIHVAFIDGKHRGDVVRQEGKLLAAHQRSGDLAIFDDCQLPEVSPAVVSLYPWYAIEYVTAPPRVYGIARRR